MPSWFYAIVVPTLWVVADAINFLYPGDEFFGWAIGSLPGLWVLLMIDTNTSPSHLLPYVLAAGGMSMAALGWTMDRLRTPFVPWVVVMAIIAGVIGTYELVQFPSWTGAIATNGSLAAYISPSINLGLLGSTVLMIAAMCLFKVMCRLRGSGAKTSHFSQWDDGLNA